VNESKRPRILQWGREIERTLRDIRYRLTYALRRTQIDRTYGRIDVDDVLAQCERQPLFSVVVPVYRTPLQWLRSCVKSVRGQLYPHWELILIDDGSKSESLSAELRKYEASDSRIRVFHLAANQGISGATNYGIARAQGQFIALLDHDDDLTPDALLWMAVAHNRNPQARWFYSDEAIIDTRGNYAGRFHRKPSYSREYLLSVMYTCHLSVYDRQLIEHVGGLRSEFDGAQDHDLALRLSEVVSPEEVVHVPQVLYFWRAIPESTASDPNAKPSAAAGRNAVKEAMKRRGIRGRVFSDPVIQTLYRVELEPLSEPKVSILIPTRNGFDLISRCVYSLRANTEYSNYEIVVIDNQSDEKELQLFLEDQELQQTVRVIRYNKPFNHSDMHNKAIDELDSELLVFLNNDTYAFCPCWLEQLVATVQLEPSIAGAGAKLYYPDKTIQHAGVVVGVGGLAGSLWNGEPGDSPGYVGRARSIQEMSAVTAALMIMRKSAFESIGGFDGERYPTSYNDVDLWIRLGEAGYRCIYNPEVHAFHFEGKSRGVDVSEQEREYRRRLTEDLESRSYVDPFWNLEILDPPKVKRRREGSRAWVLDKLRAMQDEVEALREDAGADQHSGSVAPPREAARRRTAA
jgi:GT2 family glycosyltransferase